MRVVAISDTHCQHDKLNLPMGDVLIHAGDALLSGSVGEWKEFVKWFKDQPFEHKLYVPGNHDKWVQEYESSSRKDISDAGGKLLIDEPHMIKGKFFYGSPWVLPCGPWSFIKGEAEIARGLSPMPTTLDVLITHDPPFGVLDHIPVIGNLGSKSLMMRVLEQRPRHHVFGHIHEGGGQAELVNPLGNITFHNVAQVGFGETYYKLCAVPATFDI